ncbi:MAG: metallophosphoesterase [Gammaproteobacteria bacterium]|nr:metallophosphoesterase [Gammaproteobacteria bacterium]
MPQIVRYATLGLWALFIGACSDHPQAPSQAGGATGAKARFLVLGDTGTGPEGAQQDVAAVAEQVCSLRGCDFAMVAGDNIYEQGPSSPADPLFELAFQMPYENLDFPFFMALGNHDNSNSLTGEGSNNLKGGFELSYAASPLNRDGKWRMPDRYYRAAWPEGAAEPLLELFVLDSSPVSHFFDDPNPQWSGSTLESYIADQAAYVQDGLATSKARWKFALAHHPYISNGDHGNAGQFDVGAAQDPCSIAGPLASPTCRGEQYKAFLEQTVCNKADVFFNGHDHNLMWLAPVAACGKTQHILSGAGAKERDLLDEKRNPAYYQAGGIFGFFWVQIEDDVLTAAAYTVTADGAPGNVDAQGKPAPAFEKSITRTP